MEREAQRELVRILTREVIAALQPERLATFEEDFAAAALLDIGTRAEENLSSPRPPSDALDTTLVAGMFFQALQEAEKLPLNTRERVTFIRHQAKNYLATRLAGQISLSQFFRLLNLIEEHVHHFFSEARRSWLAGEALRGGISGPKPPPEHEVINLPALRRALVDLPLLPRSRRKLTPQALEEFLVGTSGGWFRLLDFEEYFQINKKTAWAYLSQLLRAGILEHNGERANRVRYTIAKAYRR